MAKGLSGNVNSELPRIDTESPPGISLSPTTTIPNNTLTKSTPDVSTTLTKGSHPFRKERHSFKRNKNEAYKNDSTIRITKDFLY